MIMKKYLLTTLGVAAVAGLSAQARPVNWSEIPPAVRTTVQNYKGQVAVQDYETTTINGQTVYQFTFNRGAQQATLNVAANGTVVDGDLNTNGRGLSQEEWNRIPAPVQKSIFAQKGQARVENFEKQMVNGRPVYQFSFKKNGSMQNLAFNADGSSANVVSTSNAASTPAAPALNGDTVAFRDLGWTVQKPILDQSGYAKIETVTRTTRNGKTIYIARYDKNGQPQELRVAEDGTVVSGGGNAVRESAGAQAIVPLSGASKARFEDLPAAAQNTIRTHAKGAAIEDVDKGTLNGRLVYEAAFKVNGKTKELRVDESGKVVGQYLD